MLSVVLVFVKFGCGLCWSATKTQGLAADDHPATPCLGSNLEILFHALA